MVKITEVITEVEGGLGRSRRRSSSPGGLISNRGNPELALRGPGAKALGGSGGGRGGGIERQGRLGPQLLGHRCSAKRAEAPCGAIPAPPGGGGADWSPRLGLRRAPRAEVAGRGSLGLKAAGAQGRRWGRGVAAPGRGAAGWLEPPGERKSTGGRPHPRGRRPGTGSSARRGRAASAEGRPAYKTGVFKVKGAPGREGALYREYKVEHRS